MGVDGVAVGSTPAVASAATGLGGASVALNASEGVGSIDGWSRSGSGGLGIIESNRQDYAPWRGEKLSTRSGSRTCQMQTTG